MTKEELDKIIADELKKYMEENFPGFQLNQLCINSWNAAFLLGYNLAKSEDKNG